MKKYQQGGTTVKTDSINYSKALKKDKDYSDVYGNKSIIALGNKISPSVAKDWKTAQDSLQSISSRRNIPLSDLRKPIKKTGGSVKKYQSGGMTAGVRDTYPAASNKSYVPRTPAPAFKKGGAKHPGFKAVQASIAKKSGVSAKAAGAILASATRKASPAAKKANPKLKKVKG